ncbi:hypothetical protein ABPG72_007752 [Tetrahymena utriculariae]
MSKNITSFCSKTAASSQRGSKSFIPVINPDSKIIVREFANRKNILENFEENKRYQTNVDMYQKPFFSLDSQNSSRILQGQANQIRARAATANEISNLSSNNSQIFQKPKSACIFILKRSCSRKRYSSTQSKQERLSYTKTSFKGSYCEQENLLKNTYQKKEKGWDYYKDQLQKDIGRSESTQAERVSHLTTTPLVYHKNYFERKREIEQNLNCKEFGLNVQNYSVLDKRTKSFFHNQCKEEALQYHDEVKEKEQKINQEINDIIRLSISNARTKLTQKYSISKHLEQNRLAKAQLIF